MLVQADRHVMITQIAELALYNGINGGGTVAFVTHFATCKLYARHTRHVCIRCSSALLNTDYHYLQLTTPATVALDKLFRWQEQHKVNMGYDDEDGRGDGEGKDYDRPRSSSPPKIVDVEKIKPNTQENQGEIRSVFDIIECSSILIYE